MNKEREAAISELLGAYKHTEVCSLFCELLELRRQRWRDKLEGNEDEQVRGRAKECKDLLQYFS